jgi:hypothetical protein
MVMEQYAALPNRGNDSRQYLLKQAKIYGWGQTSASGNDPVTT